MKKPLGPQLPTAQGNNIVPAAGGHVRPEQFFSNANTCQPPFRSILQANAQARLAEQDMKHAYEHGGEYRWDPQVEKVRAQYRRTIVDAGNSTRNKCCDDIC